MKTERMEPPDVRRGREQGGHGRLSEYQMSRYMLGLMNEGERSAFEVMLKMDEAVCAQFQRFQASWEAERFDERRHRMPVFPGASSIQNRRVWGILRASMAVAVLGLVLWGSRSVFWMPLEMGPRVQGYLVDAGRDLADAKDARNTPAPDTMRTSGVGAAKKANGVGAKKSEPMRTKKAEDVGAKKSEPMQTKKSEDVGTKKIGPMRTKGSVDRVWASGTEPTMVVALMRGGKITQARSGQHFLKGDRLRLAHRWERGGYVFWVHRQGKTVTPLYPREGKMESVQVVSGEMMLLPGSLEVSGDGREEEWLVACFSRRPVSLGRLRAALVSLPKKMDRHALSVCDHRLHFLVRRE
ncbi:hypothetical protein L6R29_14595 [Myxococcota bacterium]|nr:hypothetical protein [Myxococcota bacterium]